MWQMPSLYSDRRTDHQRLWGRVRSVWWPHRKMGHQHRHRRVQMVYTDGGRMNGSGQTCIEDSQGMDNRRIREGIHYPDRRCGRIHREDNENIHKSQHSGQEGQAVTNSLKPCPFCGNSRFKLKTIYAPFVGCVDCGYILTGLTFKECVEKWNSRAKE